MEGELVDFVEVMYNTRYGGFGFSEIAEKLYCQAKGIEWTGKKIWNIDRADPDMIRIVKDLQGRANTTFSDIKIKVIPKKYENHYDIDEYDGLESVQIDYRKYKIDQILAVLDQEGVASEEKVLAIREIIAEKEDSEDDDDDDNLVRDHSLVEFTDPALLPGEASVMAMTGNGMFVMD